jgi:FtsH-binding integral membrane protein
MGWIFFLRTTARSLGVGGIVLCVGLAITVFWALLNYNIVSSENKTLITWLVLILFSAMLAAGMSWAHLRARWSGQATVDEIDLK